MHAVLAGSGHICVRRPATRRVPDVPRTARAEQRGVRAGADCVPAERTGHLDGEVQLCVRALVRAQAPHVAFADWLRLCWAARMWRQHSSAQLCWCCVCACACMRVRVCARARARARAPRANAPAPGKACSGFVMQGWNLMQRQPRSYRDAELCKHVSCGVVKKARNCTRVRYSAYAARMITPEAQPVLSMAQVHVRLLFES